jgi:hypothetical protein
MRMKVGRRNGGAHRSSDAAVLGEYLERERSAEPAVRLPFVGSAGANFQLGCLTACHIDGRARSQGPQCGTVSAMPIGDDRHGRSHLLTCSDLSVTSHRYTGPSGLSYASSASFMPALTSC